MSEPGLMGFRDYRDFVFIPGWNKKIKIGRSVKRIAGKIRRGETFSDTLHAINHDFCTFKGFYFFEYFFFP